MSGTCNKNRTGNKPVQTAGNVPLGIDRYKWEDNIKRDFYRNGMGLGYRSLEGLRKHGKEGMCYKEQQNLSTFNYSPLLNYFYST